MDINIYICIYVYYTIYIHTQGIGVRKAGFKSPIMVLQTEGQLMAARAVDRSP